MRRFGASEREKPTPKGKASKRLKEKGIKKNIIENFMTGYLLNLIIVLKANQIKKIYYVYSYSANLNI